jgi:hypothetical protein
MVDLMPSLAIAFVTLFSLRFIGELTSGGS